MHYNWHRYYDPDTGRYLTPDPIGLAGGINPLVYSLNNPINYFDSLGLDTRGEGLAFEFSIFGLTGKYTFQFVEDDNGDFGITLSTSCGGAAEVIGLSIMRINSSTNANSINQLHGKSVIGSLGASAWVGYNFEYEVASEYKGQNNLLGLNVGMVRSYVNLTGVLSDTNVYNLSELLDNFLGSLFNSKENQKIGCE